MSRTKNNLWIPVALIMILVLGGGYWYFFQKSQIEPFARQIDSTKVNQNKPIEMKDYVLMKRDLIASQNTLNNSVFQLVTSLFLLFTAYTAWRNLVVSEKKQIVESFAKAVEQLGSDELHTRVGGIFVLEQIAQSSPEYHWLVIEVLTSYIRDTSLEEKSTFKPSKPKSKIKKPDSDNNNIEKTFVEKIEEIEQEHMERLEITVTTDIQAALTVIGRRNSKRDPQDKVIDLRFTDIRRANLKNANLSYANLEGAKILQAQLENANLSSANLQKADLSGAKLNGANLSKSNLSNADLLGANLEGAKLNNTILYDSNFRRANLQGANLREAKLKRTTLINAQINHTTKLDEKWKQVHKININEEKKKIFDEKADFSDAILINADFEGCTLKKAIFSGANLEIANFKNANLEGADFCSSNIRGASFSGAYLKKAVFKNAILPFTDFRDSTRFTDMSEVIFEEVDLTQANFENVCLEKAKFTKSRLHNTSFFKAKLKKALFEFCDYGGTRFQQADIEGTTFRLSSKRNNIEGADFSYSNKEKANFQDVDI